MTQRNDLPPATSVNFEQRVRETLMTYLGRQGDPLDRGVTLRDLVDAGIAKVSDRYLSRRGGPQGGGPVLIPGSAESAERDLTPPPTPTGFKVTAGISHVFIEHDVPRYTQGRGHLRTHVYAAAVNEGQGLPTFDAAAPVGQFEGTFYALPTNPSTTLCLWIKWETRDQVLSVGPAGGINGLQVTTGQDVSLLLDALTGAITEGQLYQTLRDRIDLIDGVQPGSVNDRIQTEVGNRAAALLAEADARAAADAILSAVQGAFGGSAGQLAAAVQIEQQTRIDQDAALASRSEFVAAQSASSAAAVVVEQQARSDADSAMASQTTALAARLGDNAAALQLEQQARADADSSLSSQVLTLSSAVGDADAAIEVEQQVRASADSAVASQATTLATALGANSAGLFEEAQARTTADAAASSVVAGLNAAAGANSAGLLTEQQARADADSAAASSVASLSAAAGSNAAAIVAEQTTRANEDSTLSSQITTLSSDYSTNKALVQSQITTLTNADSAFAQQINTVQAVANGVAFEPAISWNFDATVEGWNVGGATGSIVRGALRVVSTGTDPIISSPTALSVNGAVNTLIRARVRRLAGTGWQGQVYYSTAGHGWTEGFRKIIPDTTVLNEWRVLEWDMAALTTGGNDWITSTIDTIRIDLGTTASDQFDVDWIAIGRTGQVAYTAAIQQESSARATAVGTIESRFTVKVNAANHVAGFGLIATANNGTTVSDFGVAADRFFIAPAAVAQATAPSANLYSGFVWLDTSVTPNVTRYWNGSTWTTTPPRLPFIVQATPTTINGVSVPAGVYIDTAFIRDGTITSAKIGNATIDNAKIADVSAGKITGGAMQVGSFIQSTNYTSGTSGAGWRINADGTAELQAAYIRGNISAANIGANTITADKIDTRGLDIKDASGNVIFSSGVNLASSRVNPAAGWLNSNITVSAGQLAGIGTPGVVVDNSYQTIGQNLLPASDQTQGSTWMRAYSPNGATFNNGSGGVFPQLSRLIWSTAPNSNLFVLRGGTLNSVAVQQTNRHTGTVDGDNDGSSNTTAADFVFGIASGIYIDTEQHAWVPVTPGERICASAYVATHRCRTLLFIAFQSFDDNGNVTESYAGFVEPTSRTTWSADGQTRRLDQFQRPYVVATVPAGATRAGLRIRKYNTVAGQSDSWVWIAGPQIEKVAANTTGPSPYMPGPPSDTRQLGFAGDIDAQRNSRITVDGSGVLQGVGTTGVTVANNQIGINASGQVYGLGAGNGIAVSNNQITVNSDGQLAGIGSSGVVVDVDYAPSDSNAITDPNFTKYATGRLGHFNLWNGWSITSTAGENNSPGAILNVTGGGVFRDIYHRRRIVAEPGERWYIRARIRVSASFTDGGGLMLGCSSLNSSGTDLANWPAISVNTSVSGGIARNTWVWVEGEITTSPSLAIAYVQPWISVRETAADGTVRVSYWYFGKVAQGATVGATWGTNVSGRPSNLAGLSGSEAIQNTQITVSNGAIQGIGTGAGTLIDATKVAGDNLIPDPTFLNPAYWTGGWEATPGSTFASMSAFRWVSSGAANEPPAALQLNNSAGSGDFTGGRIVVEQGGTYRLRMRVYKAGACSGVVWAGLHVPNQAWWTALPQNTPGDPTAGINWSAIPQDAWATYESFLTVTGAGTAQMQPRIRNVITAGNFYFTMELQRATTAELFRVQYGTGNLMRNSSFELYTGTSGIPDTFQLIGANGATVTPSVVTSPALHGSRAFQIAVTSTTGASGVGVIYGQTAADAVTVVEGLRYCLSGYFRSTTTAYRARLDILWYSDAAATVQVGSTVAYDQALTTANAWERVTAPAVVAPSGAVRARVRVGLQRPSTGDTTLGTVQIDAVQFQASDASTAYNVSQFDKVGTDNPINTANISTYIAAGAIGNAYIGNFIQSTNFNGVIDESGNITSNGTVGWAIGKGGQLVAHSGTFRGTVSAGSSPAVSGNTMSGSGAVFNPSGTFAIGNSSGNLSFNGTTLTVNGNLIATGNLQANAITKSYGVTSTSATGTGAGSQTAAIITVTNSNTEISIFSGGIVNGAGGSGNATLQLQRYEGNNPGNKVNLTTLFGPIDVPFGAVFSFPPFVDVRNAGTFTYEIWKTTGPGIGARTILLQEFKR